jgi:hypothetical protein
MKRTHVIALLPLMLIASGCIVPIPHRRLHAYGVRGSVVDARSNEPIPTAIVARGTNLHESVTCNASGEFEIKPVHGWHGAYLIGPISLSLFPGFDIAAPCATVSASAPGYPQQTFHPYGLTPCAPPLTNESTDADAQAEKDSVFINVGALRLERGTKDK